MSTWIMKRVDDAYNWLAGMGKELAGTHQVIILKTRNGRSVRSTICMSDADRGVLVIRGFDVDDNEVIEAADIHSVALTGTYRLSPDVAYHEMRQMEECLSRRRPS